VGKEEVGYPASVYNEASPRVTPTERSDAGLSGSDAGLSGSQGAGQRAAAAIGAGAGGCLRVVNLSSK
jgi:hypothetical protein